VSVPHYSRHGSGRVSKDSPRFTLQSMRVSPSFAEGLAQLPNRGFPAGRCPASVTSSVGHNRSPVAKCWLANPISSRSEQRNSSSLTTPSNSTSFFSFFRSLSVSRRLSKHTVRCEGECTVLRVCAIETMDCRETLSL
jgi:hypothetical protein